MKSCGLIVEYNPFHLGHAYHIQQARKKSQADVIVAVMSGNFLQRGEPACLDKWRRTEMALASGIDLVVELPFASAVQSADYFASGGIKLLHALGVDSLCFGTDQTETMDYAAFGKFHVSQEARINQRFQELEQQNASYPERMTTIYRELLPEWTLDFSSPNHILGMAYAKENARFDEPMILYPIARKGSTYHEVELKNQEFTSATAIRQALVRGELPTIQSFVPQTSYRLLENTPITQWSDFWPLLQYRLLTSSILELSQIHQVSEGLEYRLKEMSKKATSFEHLVELLKSKRYTWTRIQRLLTYVLLNISKKEMLEANASSYLRVLGFNEKGRSYLKQQKPKVSSPLITNINRKNEKRLSLDIKAGLVYQLGPIKGEQDYFRAPLYLKD
ncbi:nucleotidyltransferase [Vagococcus sp.]|uniref:nucleotidyltransferase n=1 Tax=Vagococcus sp. TaxID=1933889 RepID=UPI003F9458AD